MKFRVFSAILLLSLSHSSWARPRGSQVGQPDPPAASVTYAEFVGDVRLAAANSRLSEKQLDQFFARYGELLTPQMDTTRLMSALQERPAGSRFPLQPLQNQPFYQAMMQQLLHSKNANQRILGYAILGAAGDSRYNVQLLKVARQDRHRGALIWAGMALLFLHDRHTDQLFDFVVANENWQDPHLMGLYLQQDPASLLRVAKQKMRSQDGRARMLAVQSFLRDQLDSESQALLRQAVQSWEPQVRGYAIYVLAKNRLPQLKALLTPSLAVKSLRAVSLMALASSPTPEDQEFLTAMPVDSDVLDAYLEAETVPAARKWLALMQQKVPEGYTFFVQSHGLLKSDELLAELQRTLREAKDPKVIEELVRALDGRKDEASLDLRLGLLSHPDSSVRYWAADSLEGVVSPRLAEVLPGLIRNPQLRTSALTQLAVDNRVDSLRDVYRSFWLPKPSQEGEWRRSSLDYLAAFPQPEDLELLRGVAANDPDVFSRRAAVEGLGVLGDAASVDLIVAALAKEPAADANAVDYLEALGRIGGPAARAVLERYKGSQNPGVRAVLDKYLH
ncbi:HEAT repeat domain-containing protein [bacterium]|nr:HEAT repeat domain-containing protein [bacterium]